jgi:hypothetical protein
VRKHSQVYVMTDVFEFQLGEFKVLKDFEFDETVQREERVRFYTLEEQTVDAFEKMLPKGRTTKYQLDQLAKSVDKLKDLYETYIIPTPQDYEIRESEYGQSLPWISPIYASHSRTPYEFGESYAPFFTDNAIKAPGFYNRFLGALPRPYGTSETGEPYPITKRTRFVNENGEAPLYALPDFQMVRTQRYDDGRFDVIVVPRENTGDRINFTGYYLAERSLDVPNPLLEHPFLSSNKARALESNQPLKDVIPTLGAIMEHAVPVTSDPYGVAQPYLKLYDVKLSSIPWSMWKVKFPPAEALDKMAQPIDLAFPKSEENAPSEKLTEQYDSAYSPGISARFWLMNQLDGGELLIKMLLTQAIEHGSVQLIPLVDLPKLSFPDTTPDECLLLGKNFQQFQIQGNLRRRLEGVKSKYECVPMDFVRQERKLLGYLNRLPWKESTSADILRQYILAMRTYMMPKQAPKKFVLDSQTPVREDSELRKEVLAILNDEHRFPEDKMRDIQEIVKDLGITKQIINDNNGLFVVCRHSLAVLEGELAKDPRAFHEIWTASEDGFRVCKFCGERVIAENYVEQDEFTADGFVIKRAEAFVQPSFHSDSLASFNTGLLSLKDLFNLDKPSESLIFLVLSLLQVLPTKDQLQSLLTLGRTVSASIRASKESDEKKVRLEGMLGIAITVFILQSHSPMLIPRRSFGAKPLNLNGYPRDTKEPGDNMIVDTLIMVVRKTFEKFPTSFKSPALPAIRSMISNPKSFRDGVYKLMAPMLKKASDLVNALEAARLQLQGQPTKEIPSQLIPVVLVPKETQSQDMETCKVSETFWRGAHPPKTTQPPVVLRNGIRASEERSDLLPAVSKRVLPKAVTTADIRAIFKQGIPTRFKKLFKLTDSWRTNILLATRLANLFGISIPTREVDTTQSSEDLRDYAKGLVYEVLQQIDDVEKVSNALKRDITLYALVSDIDSERSTVNSIRAMERKTFTDRMRNMSDKEREITQELLKIGAAPFVIITQDRKLFAQRAEDERDLRIARILEQEIQIDDIEVGVGDVRDFEEQGEQQGDVDAGDYGDYEAVPFNDGRDYAQPQIYDDRNTSI